jgi:Ca2+-dependent lipid-binding protein
LPSQVLGVRAAGDAVNVPVNVTDVQLSGCVRLIFKPLLTYFPLFGAIEISLASKPQVSFGMFPLRVRRAAHTASKTQVSSLSWPTYPITLL